MVKELLRHPRIIPSAVILDPAITVHTPEWLWLSTGIRAVDHCVEGVCSNEAHPYGDAQALKGLALLSGGLPRVKANVKDLTARDRHLVVDGATRQRGANGREPWHRLRARRGIRYTARTHLVHHAAGCYALEQVRQHGSAGYDLGSNVARR
jgi:Iron-containing alcohol dehydrogenase